MRLFKIIKRFFWKYEKPPDPISEAIAEGMKEAFRELGYNMGLKDKT